MPNAKINDTKLIRLIDKGVSQTKVAELFGVSRQAINQRLKELRGRNTRCIVAKKVEQAVEKKLDAISQLQKINDQANQLLDNLEQSPELKLKVMAEIRGQLKLQLEIFATLYDLRAAQEFQQEVLETIGSANKEIRDEIIQRLREKRSLRSDVKFY